MPDIVFFFLVPFERQNSARMRKADAGLRGYWIGSNPLAAAPALRRAIVTA